MLFKNLEKVAGNLIDSLAKPKQRKKAFCRAQNQGIVLLLK